MIRYFKHKEINKTKWDTAIDNSFNGLFYAYSWYLDIVSPDWEALIYDDYKYIMPLTQKKKFGISYLYQPIFCQHLGVFSTEETGIFCIDDFIEAIPEKFKIIDIAINPFNILSNTTFKKQSFRKQNQTLTIFDTYENIRKKYKKSHIKNIDKIVKKNLNIELHSISCREFCHDKLKSLEEKGVALGNLNKGNYVNFLNKMNDENKLTIWTGTDESRRILGGVCFISIGHHILLQTYCNSRGRKYGLIFYLIDRFIREHAGQKLIIDFMGSSLKGVKYRNLGFGAEEDSFTFLRLNRLNGFTNMIHFLRKLVIR